MMPKPTSQLFLPLFLGSLLVTPIPAISQNGLAQQPAQPFTGGQTSGQWVSFKSDKGGFSVSVPKQLIEQTQTLNTAAGEINNHIFSASLDNGTVSYSVSYIDLPKGVESMPANLLLEAIAGGITGDSRVKVLSERVIKLDDYTGRELKVESQTKSIVNHRAYIVKQRIYQIAVEVPVASEAKMAADVDRFLNSFKLL